MLNAPDKPMPVLSALAPKYLCVPASSTKCEQVFSQGGIIDTKLRNRMKALTLEILVYLKNNWDNSLYYMSHAEKLRILREWVALAERLNVDDPTDRDYGIEGDKLIDEIEGFNGGVEMDEIGQVDVDVDGISEQGNDEVADDDDLISLWSTEDELDFEEEKESDDEA